MKLDPKLAVILNIIYQVLTGITTATLSTLGVADATHVFAVCQGIAGFINIILHAYSSPAAGPLYKDTTK
jgi:hypothetical protein